MATLIKQRRFSPGAKFALLAIGVPGLLIGCVLLYREYKHTLERERLSTTRFDKDIRALAAEWPQYEYIPLTDDTFTQALRSFLGQPADLSAEQSQKLVEAMNRFFHAYHDGTYDSFRAFRFPDGAEFEWKTNKWGSLDDWIRMMKLPKSLTRKASEEKFMAFLHRYSGGTFYSNHITGVSLHESRVVIRSYQHPLPEPWTTQFFTTNYPERMVTNNPVWLIFQRPPDTVSVAAPFPNLGLISLAQDYSFIEFKDSLTALAQRTNQVLVADCFFFIRRSSAHPFMPLIVRWYWEPGLAQWLPDDVVFCGAAQQGDPLLVF